MLKRLKKGQKREDQVVPAAKEWSKVNSRIWWLSKRVDPKDCLHVRYEDICRRPEEVMNELFDFVGFDRCDVVGETKTEGLDSDQGHTIGGNKIRFTGEKLKIREDTAWQGNLTAEELATIKNMTGGLSAKFGYEQ